jgi:hypothetical protein
MACINPSGLPGTGSQKAGFRLDNKSSSKSQAQVLFFFVTFCGFLQSLTTKSEFLAKLFTNQAEEDSPPVFLSTGVMMLRRGCSIITFTTVAEEAFVCCSPACK